MKLRPLYYAFLVFLAGLTLSSCVDKPKYPSTPEIEYRDFIRYGNNPLSPDSVEVVISFKDNEGDVGLAQNDLSGDFKNGNLWMIYFYDSNGTWAAYDATNSPVPPFDTLMTVFQVPVVLPEGDDNEPMQGLIYVKQITKLGGVSLLSHEKIKYKIYLKDKARNKSNVIETPPLVFEP